MNDSRLRLAVPWLVMAAVLAVALVVGAGGPSGPPTQSQRVHRIAAELRCPTCRNLSAAESDAAAAKAIRVDIGRRVQAGQSDGEIVAAMVGRYGDDILLKPKASGVAGLVWAIPVVAVLVAAGGVGLAFAGWRRRMRRATPSTTDRARVEQELRI